MSYLLDDACCFDDSFLVFISLIRVTMPISDCDVRDPRIRRTRQLLQEALLNLMQIKGFEEISVQDITESATVNRATFYDHYTDKYSLLEATVAGGFHKLLHERNVQFDGTCPSAASAIILAACDYLSLTHSNPAVCNRQSAFEPLVDAAITVAIRRVLANGMSKEDAAADMTSASVSGAIYGAVKQWFFTPDHVSAEEIVPVVLKLVLPILQQGRPVPQAAS
jgi:AcrR family transcriptional regulator